MGGDTPLSGLSFDIVFDVMPNSSLWWEITANTINWINTNLKGMAFGVLFGAGALTLLSLIRKRSFEGGFANAALGTVIGAPLGVCVNCAAPIALGLHMGRMRLETTLSALVSSPTLNVIVVTMSFALLPLHVAAIKLLLALVMVLLVVPLLCRYILKEETETTRHMTREIADISVPKGFSAWIARALAPVEVDHRGPGPLGSLIWFAKTYARNLFYIAIITVPMMLLAALLGSLIATFVSPGQLGKLLPVANAVPIVMAMALCAAIASFVPAPIALDVILTIVLINIGIREDYATAILIALGSFSIYAFIILWRSISLRTGLIVWGAVIAMAMAGGILANLTTPAVSRYYFAQQLAAVNAVDSISWPKVAALPPGQTRDALLPLMVEHSPKKTKIAASIEGVPASIRRYDFAQQPAGFAPAANAEGDVFTRIIGTDIGLAEQGVNSPIRQLSSHMMNGGLAAGDVHGDGWTDIVTRRPDHANGLSLYANIGGKFIRQELDLGSVDDLEVMNVALADVDGDAQLDLAVSTIPGGAFLFFNKNGEFSAKNMIQIDAPSARFIRAFAFDDMDKDGDIDILLGYWSQSGTIESWHTPPQLTRNEILWNEGAHNFRKVILPGAPGQTMSIMVADIDGDGYSDSWNGDDVGRTDGWTLFGPGQVVTELGKDNQPFPYYTRTTMSQTEGDWNNDLISDYYSAQIATRTVRGDASNGQARRIFELCQQFGKDLGWHVRKIQDCAADLTSADLIRGGKSGTQLDGCASQQKAEHRAICGAMAYIRRLEKPDRDLLGDRARFERCSAKLGHLPLMQRNCRSLLEPAVPGLTRRDVDEKYKAPYRRHNILFTGMPDGKFVDKATETASHSPGWSWNARFADLDQDGWQDILVGTGMWLATSSTSTNILYHNVGKGFKDGTDAFGLTDLIPTYSYVTLDYDRDGDIDIIRDNSALRMLVHRNDRPKGKGLWISLRQNGKNSMAIGAKVIICTDRATKIIVGKCQMRMIRASGGFMSSDPILAHFGIGNSARISLMEIRWPDGNTSTLRPENMGGGHYLIGRQTR
ncbi:MAG: FG-GAP-like repeat-containing protein [Parasphingorhabdus sp.]